jgi:diacylglycerol O-acyltransferase / wax synthase
MNDRLSALDVSFLYLEGESTPMHVGGLAVFDPPPGGFDYARFVGLVEDRISLVPRYRQKIKSVPGHIGYPVWVDDNDFDVSYHVRRSALPRPGSGEQLRELVARLQSRPLDRSRPLWEMNVVEGLAGGGFAIITKTHHAMVDGISAIDLAQVILDPTPRSRAARSEEWHPRDEPGPVDLVVDAVRDLISRPGAVVDTIRMGVNDARATSVKLVDTVGGLLSAARIAARPAPSSPLNAVIGAQRRFAVARTSLSDYKTVRSHGQGTVNDVVLATVAGALRGWLMARGRAVTPTTTVRAMVPLSVRTGPASELGNRVSSYLIDLPVGEPNPLVRLTQISYAMAAHKESGQSVGADALIALSGFAPPTLHALGARAANSFTRRLFNLVITNVPGPQYPLFADGAQLREMFPIVPLAGGQAVSIGLTSYDGNVFYGLNGDRDAMGDVDTLATLIEESLAELVAAVRATATAPGRAAATTPERTPEGTPARTPGRTPARNKPKTGPQARPSTVRRSTRGRPG